MNLWKRLATVASVALVLLAGGAVVASPAFADDSGELPGCQYWEAVVGGPGREVKDQGNDEIFYAHTDIVYVPGSWSACEDINVGQGGDVWQWRIRFYPSSGGNYANAWKSGCNLCLLQAATNVSNGTRFRLEGRKYTNGGYQIYQRLGFVYM